MAKPKIRKKSQVEENSRESQLLCDLIQEFQGTKRLLALLLVKLGSNSNELGAALNIHPGTVRNEFPFLSKISPAEMIPIAREGEK